MCLHGCARRLALLSALRRDPHTRGRITCAATTCGERYWANAIPGVQGILERDGRVLLARRELEPRRGHWDLPGGFLNETEAPADGLRREFREETGLDVEPVRAPPDRHRAVRRALRVLGHLDRARRRRAGRGRRCRRAALVRAATSCPEMAFPGQELVLAAWARAGRARVARAGSIAELDRRLELVRLAVDGGAQPAGARVDREALAGSLLPVRAAARPCGA